MARGSRPEFLLFWGHIPAKDGSVTKACFSQWWTAPFVIDGLTYPTAEHFMMASKARLFGDDAAFKRVLNATSPKQAKVIGRGVQGFDDELWTQERCQLVIAGNLAKFSQHPPLWDFLLSTGEKVLVEASPYDRIWGIGLSADDERAGKPEQWRGLNLLGFALMEVRERLKNGIQTES
jgi:ribA/ribD-fused uncharacterized protein